jgi:hypothetical protein
MTDRTRPTTPRRLDVFPSGEIGIVWEDGHESVYAARELRALCPCAACVDEVTGRRILDPATIPGDIVPRLWNGVGHYGVQFVWSDLPACRPATALSVRDLRRAAGRWRRTGARHGPRPRGSLVTRR